MGRSMRDFGVNIEKKLDSQIITDIEDLESVIKHKLGDIENFVRDDFKSEYQELKHEIIEEFDQKFIQSASNSYTLDMGILVMMIVSMLLLN